MENYQEALCYFLMSLKDAELQGKKSIKGYNYNRLGDLYYKQEDYHKSEQCYYNALSFGHKIGHPDIIWEAHSGLGLIYTSQKQFSRAVKQYKKAIEVIEDLRSHILIREHSSGFFKSKIHIYGQLVNLYFDLHTIDPSKGYDKECFYYVEKAKARVFLDDLREIKPDFKTILTSQERQNEIESLSKMISYIMTRLNSSSLDRSEKAELLNKLEKAEDNIQSAIEIAKKENPDYIKSFHNEPLRVDKVQNKLLDEKTMLVEYFAGEKNLFIFFITQDDISVFRLPYDVSESTQELVENYVKLLSSKDISDSDCKFVGRSLYERLFLPQKNKLRADIKNLIIIPDRYLYYLPFEMLSHKESGIKNKFIFLVEDYNISYAPSASTLISILHKEKKAGNQKDLLVIGDPVYNSGKEQMDEAIDSDDILYDYYQKRFDIHPLSFAIKEVKSISSLIKNGSKLIICQEKATEENVKKLSLIEYKIIHFATHSLLDDKVANRSALVLTLDDDPVEDGFFQVREIYNEKLDSDLVVLSACQTARGKMEKGEGIQGLPRAFFYAGAKSVLSSLWNINDRSTAEFMKHFYKYLSHGKTKQEALRLTKIKMLHSKYNHPYYWAAFVLTGDSDSIISLSKKPFWEKLLIF
jgi:CHAT domain-containing protein